MKKNNHIIYTEDCVPVNTVYVSGIPINTNKLMIQQYFERYFGKIDRIFIRRKYRNIKKYFHLQFSYAVVTFSDYNAAANAIRQKKHLFNSKIIKVFKADTWFQTLSTKSKSILNRHTVIVEPKKGVNTTTLLNLNDYNLLHICQYLSIIDLLHLQKVNERFQVIVHTYLKRFKTFSIEKDLSPGYTLSSKSIRHIFPTLGKTIKHLHIAEQNFITSDIRYLDHLFRLCYVLESIYFYGFYFTPIMIQKKLKLHSLKSQLKSILFTSCNIVGENFLPRLIFPNMIESLSIKNCKKFPEFTMLNLKCLKSLCIIQSNLIQPVRLEHVKQLQSLIVDFNIFNCYKKTYDDFQHLKSLNIQSSDDISPVLRILADINKLKHLNVSKAITSDLTSILPKFRNLQILKVDKTNEIRESCLLNVVHNCDLLYLSSGSIQISHRGFLEIVHHSEHLVFLESNFVDLKVLQDVINLLSIYSRPKLTIICEIIFKAECLLLTELLYKNTQWIDVLRCCCKFFNKNDSQCKPVLDDTFSQCLHCNPDRYVN